MIVGTKSSTFGGRPLGNFAYSTCDFGLSWEEASLSAPLKQGIGIVDVTYDSVNNDFYFLVNDGSVYRASGRATAEWVRAFTIEAVEPDLAFGSGFTRLVTVGEGRFVAVRGSNSREGIWSKLSIIEDGKTISESTLRDAYVVDIIEIHSGLFIACGYTQSFLSISNSEFRVQQNGVLFDSTDGRSWGELYEREGVIQSTDDGGETWRVVRGKGVQQDSFYFTGLMETSDRRVGVTGSDGSLTFLRTEAKVPGV